MHSPSRVYYNFYGVNGGNKNCLDFLHPSSLAFLESNSFHSRPNSSQSLRRSIRPGKSIQVVSFIFPKMELMGSISQNLSVCIKLDLAIFLIRKKLPTFSKNSPKSHQVKNGQNIYNKAQFESPNHLQQTRYFLLYILCTTNHFWNLEIPITNLALKLLI
jgi:hypothetical protein